MHDRAVRLAAGSPLLCGSAVLSFEPPAVLADARPVLVNGVTAPYICCCFHGVFTGAGPGDPDAPIHGKDIGNECLHR